MRIGYGPYFYPLDGILHWNRMYGRKGFQQYQCLVPAESAEPAIDALLRAIAQSGTGSFLAVLKRCADLPSPGLLSFPRSGTTLALDFAQGERIDTQLFPRLDAIVREAGARFTWDRYAEEIVEVYREAAVAPHRGSDEASDDISDLALSLVGPTGWLPPDVQRALLAVSTRAPLRGPVFAALRAGYRALYRARRLRPGS